MAVCLRLRELREMLECEVAMRLRRREEPRAKWVRADRYHDQPHCMWKTRSWNKSHRECSAFRYHRIEPVSAGISVSFG